MKIKLKMTRYASKVKGKLTTILDPAKLETLARQSQFIQRSSSRLTGKDFVVLSFIESYEALGIQEIFPLCAIGPASHEEVLNTIRLFGEQVIPHFKAKAQTASTTATTTTS